MNREALLRGGALLLAGFALGRGVLAQSSLDLGTVQVVASAESPSLLAPTASSLTIDSAAIAAQGATSLADVVEKASTLYVNRSGPNGAVATASIRGSTSGQVLVILDGQRLNDARQGAPDLSLIPASSIAKVEILSAGASAVYGPDAMGGVIVITTKRAAGNGLTLGFENSSYPTTLIGTSGASLADAQRISLDGRFEVGGVGVRLGATGEKAANAYPYAESAVREGADLLSGGVTLGMEGEAGAGRFRLNLSGGSQDAGVPGELGNLTPGNRQKDYSARGSLGWSSDALLEGNLSLDLLADGAWTRLDYADPSWPSTSDSLRAGIALRGHTLLSDLVDLGFGGTVSHEGMNTTAYSLPSGEQPSRTSFGAYLEPTINVGRLKLVPALRYDWSGDYPAGFTFMTGAAWSLAEGLELRASGGSSYRAPTFNELWWAPSNNPSLKPERAVNAEAGLDWRLGGLSLSLSSYARLVEDLIVNDANWIPQNLASAFIPGLSASALARLGALELGGSLEYNRPLDTTQGATPFEGTPITKLSALKAEGRLALHLGAFDTNLAGRFWSDRPYYQLPAVFLLDAGLGWEPRKGLRFELRGENLLNQSYQLNAGYPMPGLTVKSGMTLSL